MLTDPIRELHAYPVSDGAVGMILATEDVARKICPTPVWITGVGNCMDSFFLGDRDLTSNFALKKSAERACKRAGITDPKSAFDVVELSDQYAYQLPMWAEGIGLCEAGGGGNGWMKTARQKAMSIFPAACLPESADPRRICPCGRSGSSAPRRSRRKTD